jgi:hypothetical protein
VDVRGSRQDWKEAFDIGGETACEKLGAVHLLGHGIYAFKAHGQGGGCTDLILGSPARSDNPALKWVEAAVLTEWKVANSRAEAAKKIEEAYEQSKIYAGGILGGIELQTVRYLIVVTPHQELLPEDRHDGGVRYRHVCLPVAPDAPSAASRRLAGEGRAKKRRK